jgi:nitroimidazol reductase NimA-like FMN-containing flavoprotein (pyridoxamine 5'-phosphate oxidase superfamily)
MPDDYGIPRDGSGADILSWEQIEQWLRDSRNYWVSSTNADGSPHVMPVWGLWFEGAVAFSTSRTSRKGRNLVARPDVAIHLESGDNVVILHGKIAEMTDRDQLERMADAYDKKYEMRPDPHDPGNITFALYPAKALTWLERDFPNTATRWRWDERKP